MYPMHTVNFVVRCFAGLDILVKVKSRFLLYKLAERFCSSQTDTTCRTELLKTSYMKRSQ